MACILTRAAAGTLAEDLLAPGAAPTPPMQRTLLVPLVMLGIAAIAWIGWATLRTSARPVEALTPPATAAPGLAPPADVPAALPEAAAAVSPRVSLSTPPTPEPSAEAAESTGILDILLVRTGMPGAVPEIELQVGSRAGTTPPFHSQMRSDGRGRARVEVPAERQLFLVAGKAAWYESAGALIAPLAPGEVRTVEYFVRFAREWIFHGQVLSEEEGQGLAGVRVTRPRSSSPISDDPAGEGTGIEDPDVVATSDAQGLFRLEEYSINPGTFELHADGYSSLRFRVGEGHGTADEARELRLLRTARIVVLVTQVHGEALQVLVTTRRSWATFGEDGLIHNGRLEWHGTLEPDGTCTLEDLRARVPLTIELYRGRQLLRRMSDALVLEPGETREVTWSLAGARLRGLVLRDDRSPVGNQTLWLLRRDGLADYERRAFRREDGDIAAASTRTDDGGRFVLEDLAPGNYWLGPAWGTARRGQVPVLPIGIPVEVPPGTGEVLVELLVPPLRFVRGVVLAPDGTPAAGVQVVAGSRSIWSFHATDPASGWTDEKGRFRLGPMPPGEYRVSASGKGASTPEPVSVAAGEDDLLLRLIAGGSVSGRTLDARTSEPTSASCMFFSVPDGHPDAPLVTGEHFRITLRPGSYVLVATATGNRIGVHHPIVVHTNESIDNVEVHLERGTNLSVRSTGDGRLGIRVRWNGLIIRHAGLRPGIPTLHVIPAGEVEVELLREGELIESRHLTVSAGDDMEVLFDH